MIHLRTFCNDKYTISAEKLCLSAMKHGCDTAGAGSDKGLPELFRQLIGDNIFEVDRFWFYIWKPFYIWQEINKLPTDSILIYCDAGTTIVDSVVPLVQGMDQDIMIFSNPWSHVEWCKWDVLHGTGAYLQMTKKGDNMGYTDLRRYKQAQASLIIFKVNEQTRNFVKEWMLYCLMPGFCDNSPSKIPNYPTFQEHRYDQAVLTCLQIKNGYKLHEIPRIDNGNAVYRCIDHHRKSNEQW